MGLKKVYDAVYSMDKTAQRNPVRTRTPGRGIGSNTGDKMRRAYRAAGGNAAYNAAEQTYSAKQNAQNAKGGGGGGGGNWLGTAAMIGMQVIPSWFRREPQYSLEDKSRQEEPKGYIRHTPMQKFSNQSLVMARALRLKKPPIATPSATAGVVSAVKTPYLRRPAAKFIRQSISMMK